jgi:peptidyl-prolyl cis-trans isomerase C
MTPAKLLVRIVLLVLPAIVLNACGPDYVAKVNDTKISKKEYERYKNQRIRMYKTAGTQFNEQVLKKQVLNELIVKALVINGAAAKGIKVSDSELKDRVDAIKGELSEEDFIKQLRQRGVSYEEFLQDLKDQLLIERFRKSFADISSITFEDVKKQYESNRPVKQPERVRIRIMHFNTEEEAKKVFNEMKTNKIPFDEMAEKLSREGRAIVSTSDWVEPASFSPEMAKAIRSTQKGSYSEPVKGNKGWFIIKIYERQEAQYATFEEAKEQLMFFLIEKRRHEGFRKWLIAERNKAKIKVLEKAL